MTEFEARTVKEAIEEGLKALQLSEDDVVIDVIEEGRSGVLGVGSRPALVRITPKDDRPATEVPAAEPETTPDEEDASAADAASSTPDVTEPALQDADASEITEPVLAIAADFLTNLLGKMGLQTGIETEVMDSEDDVVYRLNITGDDLGILIGRRAETLDAIQYLTRLVVNQQTHRWYRMEVDVENYKRRREHSLQRLANTLADQAVREKRVIMMEPMLPRERRLIHLALRERSDVRTESVGEGDARKVTIIPE